MTTDSTGGQGAPATPPAGGGQAGGTGEATSGQAMDARMGRIEQTQAEQGGVLARIEQMLAGRKDSSTGAEPPPGPSIAEQVAEGARMIDERRQADQAQSAAAAQAEQWRKSVEQRLARPQEPMGGFKRRLQRMLVGRPDER